MVFAVRLTLRIVGDCDRDLAGGRRQMLKDARSEVSDGGGEVLGAEY